MYKNNNIKILYFRSIRCEEVLDSLIHAAYLWHSCLSSLEMALSLRLHGNTKLCCTLSKFIQKRILDICIIIIDVKPYGAFVDLLPRQPQNMVQVHQAWEYLIPDISSTWYKNTQPSASTGPGDKLHQLRNPDIALNIRFSLFINQNDVGYKL